MELKIPDDLAAQAAAVAETRGLTPDALITEMVSEGLKMLKVPGILFADGATGRRARIGGTGIEVFEVIDRYERVGRDRDKLQQIFHWLGNHQIAAAVAYFEAYPDEIKARLHTDEEDQEAIEALWREIPQTSPEWPGRRASIEAAASHAREMA